MKHLYFAFLLSALLMFRFQSSFAQEIDAVQAKDLLSKNARTLNLTPDDIQNSVILNSYIDKISKAKLVYVQQSFEGIPVYNVIQTFAFKNDVPVSKSGNRIYKIEDQVTNGKAAPSISAREAVSFAAGALNISTALFKTKPLIISRATSDQKKVVFELNPVSQEPVTSELMWVPDENGKVTLGWQVAMLPQKSSDHWMIRVDAKSGAIIGKDNLTVYCSWGPPLDKQNHVISVLSNLKHQPINNLQSLKAVNSAQYRVIPFPAESMNHPGGALTLVNNPWSLSGPGNNATTLNWQNDGTAEYNYTRGNNVWAREDIAGDNDSPVGDPATSTSPLPNLLFDFPQDPNLSPGATTNKNLAITNLFYWNNIMHDLSYQYGFDEVSGNFQNNNLGRGGVGIDYVIADAQDGSSRNNANFGTPADGGRPRMQMFLWDGDIYHKVSIVIPGVYTGFINTLEGNMSTANLLKDVGPVTGDLVLYNDDLAGTTHLACAAPANGSALSGKIAVIDRGTCNFAAKVKNAQVAGAIAVLVINSNPSELIVMGGSDNTITIPALMMLKEDGDVLKTYLASKTITATLKQPLDVDGDLDNGIIAHEYTHGISNRLTGGPSAVTCLQNNEQMGEGWSDYVALMATTNWGTATISDGANSRSLGTYVLSEAPSGGGIRTYPYSTNMTTNPLTYSNLATIADGEEHLVGEIWAATLWDMTWNMIQMDGINTNLFDASGTGGNSDAMKLVMLGMKLQPCSPGFLDGRDAILKADEILFSGKYSCAIWSAFSRRGMGVNAKQGSAYNNIDQTANFDIPSGASITKKVDITTSPQNGILTYTFTVKAQCQPVTNFKVVDTLGTNVTYVSGGTYNSSNRTVTFNVPSLTSLQTTAFTLKVKVNSGTYFTDVTLFSENVPTNSVPSSFTATTNVIGINWGTSTINKSGPYSMKTATTGAAAEQVLTSAAPVTIDGHVQLSFWQQYSSQPGKDGGVVELSLDAGTTWFDAGPYMVQNGYNTTVNSNSSLDGKKAFSGSSNSFIQTIINLSAFRNQNVLYRFRFVTDTAGSSLGWYIDDILVKKMAAVYNIAKVFDNTDAFKSLSDTITAITNAVVPVTWQEFTVQKNGMSALLKWSTAQESNTDKFYIEHSIDGVHFNTIASLPAAGNSGTTTQYSYQDDYPYPGVNYYRIRLVDLDGKTTYSTTKAIQFDELQTRLVQLSPNPAKNKVNIFIPGNKSLLKVKLVDATGRILHDFEMKSDRLTIPVAHLAQGVYYIKIQGKNMNTLKKLMKE